MRNLLSIAILLVSVSLQGQLDQENPSIADRYPGGANTLRKFIGMNAKYPSSAANAGRMGLSIASITITPQGIIDNAAIHNNLGEDIDRTVADLLYLTEGQWLPSKDYYKNQTFYFQLSFEFEASRKDEHFSIQGDTILEEVKITVMGYNPPDFIGNKSLKKKLDRFIEKERYDNALEILEEFIHRDPFNVYYHEFQALCYEGLDRIEAKAEVEGRIQDYHNHDALYLLRDPVVYGNIKIIDPLEDGTFSVKELRRDSTIIYSGKLASVTPKIRQGKYYFFNPEGKIVTTGEFLENLPVGTWNYYDAEGHVVHSLDYSALIKFLLEEEANPLFDSTFLGSNDPLMNANGSFAVAEIMPLFNGMDPAREFKKYISEQIIYPMFARIKGIEGRVLIQFTIDKEGRVREPVVVSGAYIDLNMEALRIIINSPSWTPGSIGGTNVNVVFTFPATFRLDGGLDLIDLFY